MAMGSNIARAIAIAMGSNIASRAIIDIGIAIIDIATIIVDIAVDIIDILWLSLSLIYFGRHWNTTAFVDMYYYGYHCCI